MEDVKEGKDYRFPNEEKEILKLWDEIDAFKEQLRRTEGKKKYTFYDGPPFATGLPHYGHLLAGTIKDIVTRYASATGHYCPRRFGWDCHGLPVEYEIDKKLNVTSRDDVLRMGIDKYNDECRSIVMRYSSEWEKTVRRIGRWIDFQEGYKTLDPTFMESVWWVFSELHKKGLVYRGYKVMPYSTGCCTPLSNFEAGLNYKDVADPAVMVSFALADDPDRAEMIAWTTTPWTLPSNLALCVNPEFDYVRARDPASGRVYIVASARLAEIPGAAPKAKKAKKGAAAEPPAGGWQVLASVKGNELAGQAYTPLFPYFAALAGAGGAFRVVADGYVTADSGTGVVHCAPAFGEDDMRVCIANGIVAKGAEVPCPVDADGRFTSDVAEFAGRFVKDADRDIIAELKAAGRLVDFQTITHSYPFCWRSETPLIYKAVPSWFIAVEKIKPQLLACNAETTWVPAYVKDKRFHNWLETAHDWAVSRSRFWGTPLPIWASADLAEIRVIGSVAELEAATGAKVMDLHRHFIDNLTIPDAAGTGVLRRVDEVFDCWFESGSMPYGQVHYPFEHKEAFEAQFPADFVAEGLDQTRGWFYTLMVLSTALFGKPAFRNLVCNGLVLAADGKKMSKRLKNYPDPNEILDEYGADALRLYLINSPVVRAETLKFRKEGVFNVIKDVMLPWFNAYRFLVQNALRWESEAGSRFDPLQVDVLQATNVLDRWICAASRSLTSFVRREMGAYRLYTVVPFLVQFIEALTNVYVRFNRTRLKGRRGEADCRMALACLFDVLLTVCKAMAPFTPFFCEMMYRNLRRALPPGALESVHWCDFPEAAAAQAGDKEIQASVTRMRCVIELARNIRDRHNKPLKQPLRRVIISHEDAALLSSLAGELREYVLQEANVCEVEICADPLEYASVRAEPNYQVLGKKVGKALAKVKAALTAMTPAEIAAFERNGGAEVAGERLTTDDVRVVREFRLPEGISAADLDAASDPQSGLLVVLDLRPDDSLQVAGLAREVTNRIQKLRKHAGLVASEPVEVWLGERCAEAAPSEAGTAVANGAASNGGAVPFAAAASAGAPIANGEPQQANGAAADRGAAVVSLGSLLETQAGMFAETLGTVPRLAAAQPPHAVVIAREAYVVGADSQRCSFEVVLTRPAVSVCEAALLQACSRYAVSYSFDVVKQLSTRLVHSNVAVALLRK
ncbi:hypothetical protein WJX81_001579 [Elliptochloris bilobata]|uniref:isoleucine--tRNA ligase n=1 Tax=Elliptochloris bilobata TaxID=381761 RepID=A0AAW1QYP2_9CHLO